MKIDGKGRMSIPSPFRDALAQLGGGPEAATPKFNLLWGFKDHLEVYPIAVFNQTLKGIFAMQPGSEQRIRAERQLLHRAEAMSVLDGGRIVMPQRHRDRLGLEGEVILTGAGDHFEIWPAEVYERIAATVDDWDEDDVHPMSLVPMMPPPGAQ